MRSSSFGKKYSNYSEPQAKVIQIGGQVARDWTKSYYSSVYDDYYNMDFAIDTKVRKPIAASSQRLKLRNMFRHSAAVRKI